MSSSVNLRDYIHDVVIYLRNIQVVSKMQEISKKYNN